jgi:energy-coupling factor transporter ATP-binding protein EcfA2
MIYWLITAPLIGLIVLVSGYFRLRSLTRKRLKNIRERWAKPIEAYRNFKLISGYLSAYNFEANISADTAADLDIDSVFSFIDRTNSRPGQQLLYKKLHCFDPAGDSFNKLEVQIEGLCKEQDRREHIELKLSELNSVDAYHLPELFSKEHQSLFSPLIEIYIKISPILVITSIVALSITGSQVFFLWLLALLLTNTAIHFLNKKNILKYTHSLPQLLKLISVSRWLVDKTIFDKDEAVKQSLEKVSKLKKSLVLINVQNGMLNDPTDVTYVINEWFKMLFLIEPIIFVSSIAKVNKYLGDIKILYDAVAKVDICISIQSVRDGLPYYCKPDFNGVASNFIIKDLYHPLIENCVANSIRSDNSKVVLITGSNMSGKTTFIRAIALNTLLAQTIHTCCAVTYQAPALKILTSIHMNDDLDAHKSYFQAEALSVLNIINNSSINESVKSLVIIDEIFRGTNTIERIAAAMSVLTHLIENENFVFVSTHDLELAELLGNNNTVYSFEELINDAGLVFDYKIKEGVLKNKNGINVLLRLGYPQTIIDAAFNASKQLRDKYDL